MAVNQRLWLDADGLRVGSTQLWTGGGVGIGTNSIYGSLTVGSGTGTGSASFFGDVTVSGNVLPGTTLTYNLGSSTQRFAVAYVGDLSMRNEIGDWTIVEGADDLYLYNNLRGKVYKFNLTEVDPDTAPPKKGT